MKSSFDPDEFERTVREEAEHIAPKPKPRQHRGKGNGHDGIKHHVLPSPSKPMAVARVFIARNHTEDGNLTLRYWRGAWWSWRRSYWREFGAARNPQRVVCLHRARRL